MLNYTDFVAGKYDVGQNASVESSSTSSSMPVANTYGDTAGFFAEVVNDKYRVKIATLNILIAQDLVEENKKYGVRDKAKFGKTSNETIATNNQTNDRAYLINEYSSSRGYEILLSKLAPSITALKIDEAMKFELVDGKENKHNIALKGFAIEVTPFR